MMASKAPGLRIKVETRSLAHDSGDWNETLSRLDSDCGIYCASLHGVPGLHPRFSWAVSEAALRLQILANSVLIEAVGPSGRGILDDDALANLIEVLVDGRAQARLDTPLDLPFGRHPVARWLRAFLSVFDADEPFGLYGALTFEAHKLNAAWDAGDSSLLGVLLLPEAALIQHSDGPLEHLQFKYPATVQTTGVRAQFPVAPIAVAGGTDPILRDDDHPQGGHAAVVAQGLDVLADQSLVSLTLSQSFRRPWNGSAAWAFERLRSANPAPVTFLAHLLAGEHLLGASPDLQLVVRGRRVRSFPVCGTVRRTPGPIGHAQALKSLINETVDEAALAICSDALKNDLTPLCEPGSVRLTARREPLSLATLVHAVDALEGELLSVCDGLDAVLATAAPAMVTGTPRALALATIEQLESSARAWYGGMVVRIGSRGDAEAGTILRAAWLHNGVAEVRTGGDLVVGSDPLREDEETRLKAISLWRALGLEASPAIPSRSVDALNSSTDLPPVKADRRHRVRANRLIWQPRSDPFGHSLNDLLGSAELACAANVEEVLVLSASDPVLLERIRSSHAGIASLAIGQAGSWLLERECEALSFATQIQNGRLLWVQSTLSGSTQWPSSFYAGAYGRPVNGRQAHGRPVVPGIRELEGDATPMGEMNGWQCVQATSDGEWVSAVNPETRTIALCFRPDSILSEIGARQTLRAALDWLRSRS